MLLNFKVCSFSVANECHRVRGEECYNQSKDCNVETCKWQWQLESKHSCDGLWVPCEKKGEDAAGIIFLIDTAVVPLPSVPDNVSNSSPPPMSYITSQEMKCILHWLARWSGPQHGYFSTAPGKLQPLLESLEQTDHLVSLSASCVFGISGLEAGLSRNAMNFSGSWRSVSQTSWQNFTKQWLQQLVKNVRH